MMKRTSLALLSLLVFATPAQALKLIVWDPDFKSKVAYGETSGGKFLVKYDKDYSGPIVALFSQTDDEKEKATYMGLRSSYQGVLRGGQLLIENSETPAASSSNGNGNSGNAARGNGAAASAAAKSKNQPQNQNNLLPLPKLLQPYKLNISVQPTSQVLPLSNSLLVSASQASDRQLPAGPFSSNQIQGEGTPS